MLNVHLLPNLCAKLLGKIEKISAMVPILKDHMILLVR